VLQLRQGFGRLIRSHADRGVVAILDPRVASRPYGRAFLESLPACPVAADRAAVADFFTQEALMSA
jgi:ATP-dependent DNA helicase DinG